MKLHSKIPVDAPAESAWKVLGREYGDIGQWASSIPASRLNGELGVGAVRTCQSEGFGPFPGGDFQEVLTEFDDDAMRFAYVGTQGLPWFLESATNHWSIEPLGQDKCIVHSRATLRFVWYMRPLAPLMKMAMVGALRSFGEELAHRVERGQPHPRKVARIAAEGLA